MTTEPSLRVGDAEREAVAAELREHFARGRLTAEEFNQRLDATFAARTRGDLTKITADLPSARSGPAPLPSSGVARGFTSSGHHHSGRGSWSGSGERSSCRASWAGFATLAAALVSLLIVFDAMASLQLPIPGRLGIFVAIFTIVRGLIRRVFGGGRGRSRRRW